MGTNKKPDDADTSNSSLDKEKEEQKYVVNLGEASVLWKERVHVPAWWWEEQKLKAHGKGK